MNRRWAKAAIPNETSMRQTEDDASCAEGILDMLQEYIRESNLLGLRHTNSSTKSGLVGRVPEKFDHRRSEVRNCLQSEFG